MSPTIRSFLTRYAIAVLAVTLAWLVRLLLDPVLGDKLPFLLSCLAVVTVAWHSGFGPSFVALVLGVFATAYFFLPPRYSLAQSLEQHQLPVVGFLFLGVTIGLFSERLRTARHRAEAGAREAERRKLELEQEVAERKRLEQELHQRADELAQADRRKDDFLATLAHELRNPLAPIRNGLQLLRLAGDDRATTEQAQGMMERQLAQMVRLIDDLLDVSRITRGKLELRKARVELATVVQSAVEGCRPLLEACGHELTISVSPEPVYLEADPVRLSQVLGNLLTNAAKYTDRGGHVWLRADRQGPEVVVAVQDTGIGIAAEHLPRLFEMFSQVAPALERSQGGLGIGLSLVKGLVEMHGGRVEARSDGPGKGSEFIVRLPVSVELPGPGTSPAAKVEPARRSPGRRILVVDDNRDAADSLAMLLRLQGHETHTAHDGREAVAAAERLRPDVVLLDIGLPGQNGYEAARHIRALPWAQQTVLVAITGWGQEEDKRRALEAGFDHHLTKPVAPAELEKLLGGLVMRHQVSL